MLRTKGCSLSIARPRTSSQTLPRKGFSLTQNGHGLSSFLRGGPWSRGRRGVDQRIPEPGAPGEKTQLCGPRTRRGPGIPARREKNPAPRPRAPTPRGGAALIYMDDQRLLASPRPPFADAGSCASRRPPRSSVGSTSTFVRSSATPAASQQSHRGAGNRTMPPRLRLHTELAGNTLPRPSLWTAAPA